MIWREISSWIIVKCLEFTVYSTFPAQLFICESWRNSLRWFLGWLTKKFIILIFHHIFHSSSFWRSQCNGHIGEWHKEGVRQTGGLCSWRKARGRSCGVPNSELGKSDKCFLPSRKGEEHTKPVKPFIQETPPNKTELETWGIESEVNQNLFSLSLRPEFTFLQK